MTDPWSARERDILRARASSLAKPTTAPVVAGRSFERALLVGVSGERCALPTSIVRGVSRLRHWAPLPRVRPEVAGLFAWSGQIHVAFQLRSILAIPLSTLPEGASVVLVGETTAEAGLVVDTLHDTLEIDLSSLHPTPERFSSRSRQLLHGVTPDGIPVIDAHALLASTALYVRPPTSSRNDLR